MAGRYSVIPNFDTRLSSLFEGTSADTAAWLKKQDDVSIYKIYSPSLRRYFTVSQFLQRNNKNKGLIG